MKDGRRSSLSLGEKSRIHTVAFNMRDAMFDSGAKIRLYLKKHSDYNETGLIGKIYKKHYG